MQLVGQYSIMKIDMLQNFYEMVRESRLLFGVEIRTVDKGGKQ